MDQYLKETKMLNYQEHSLQTLIDERGWDKLDDYNKIGSIYDFVQNEILFGYNRGDLLTASQVLEDGIGQCNTKSTLLIALLRAVEIPGRLHGSLVSKEFQPGATNRFLSAAAPGHVVHTWAEVFYEGKWVALEGVITDRKYFEAVKRVNPQAGSHFRGYAIATDDFNVNAIKWSGKSTYVQHAAVTLDYGTFASPDEFWNCHPQTWGSFKNFLYVHFGRKVMNRRVSKMRCSCPN